MSLFLFVAATPRWFEQEAVEDVPDNERRKDDAGSLADRVAESSQEGLPKHGIDHARDDEPR